MLTMRQLIFLGLQLPAWAISVSVGMDKPGISPDASMDPNMIKKLNSFGLQFHEIEPSSPCQKGKASSSLSAFLCLAMATINSKPQVYEEFWSRFDTDQSNGLAAVDSIMAVQDKVAKAKKELPEKLELQNMSDRTNTICDFEKHQGLGPNGRRRLIQFATQQDWSIARNDIKDFFASSFSDFTIANSIWTNHSILDSVQEELKKFKAEWHSMTTNFLSEANNWVKVKTNGMIPSIFSEDPQVDVVLINAMVFKGYWQFPFNDNFTREETMFGNKEMKYEMMKKWFEDETKVDYYENEHLQAVRLPYVGKYDAVVILPNEDTTKLKYDMDEILTGLDRCDKLILELPKFRLETTFDNLIPGLKDIGITELFQKGALQMTELGESVGKVSQKVFIEVDAEGTKAAAVTYTSGLCMRGPPDYSRPKEMFCNRPFWFNLVDRDTGLVLFWSQVDEPTPVKDQVLSN